MAGSPGVAFPLPAGGTVGLTVRDLAARYGVAPGTVGNAILRGARQGRPAPDPLYTDRVTGARHFHPAAFDRWWRDRPHARRPPPRPAACGPDHHGMRRVVDVLPDLDDWRPAVPSSAAAPARDTRRVASIRPSATSPRVPPAAAPAEDPVP